MFPTDEDRNVSLVPLLADLIQDILDKGVAYKAPAENHIEVECVGDSRDAGPLRDAASSPMQPMPLEFNDGPAEGSAPTPASVPFNTIFKGKQKKSILSTESKYKEKLRQRMRLLFAPDADSPARQFKPPRDSSLGTKLMPSPDKARVETRLDALAKRLLTLECNMDTLSLKMSF